ncbi:hypothetical protein V5O48_001239 [Marasmius crinis-equi]|uniref:DUF6534 domain-containing protein n=1 Tax=Marasmius crinis-equi TaxID=585013 RepID=A0ABR3FZF9_9AGAR
MQTLRRFKAAVLGDDLDPESIADQLELGGIPITDADCRNCADPCDEGHEPYPSKFDVDMETQMLGTVKAYHRQIVISTGKIDWDREITTMKGTLAFHFEHDVDRHKALFNSTSANRTAKSANNHSLRSVTGVHDTTDPKITRVTVLNGSHRTLMDDEELDTVLIFPDYKLVCGVPRTKEGVQKLWDGWVDPRLGPDPLVRTEDKEENVNMNTIPYPSDACKGSHKRRDNRCSIAASKLRTAFTHSLERAGYQVDTELEHPSEKPLEELDSQEEQVEKQLKDYAGAKKVLLLRNSHTGGHKFAGNCIIYTPQRYGIWYGRVSTHEVDAIVSNTIEKGLVLPALLRGGVNLARPERDGKAWTRRLLGYTRGLTYGGFDPRAAISATLVGNVHCHINFKACAEGTLQSLAFVYNKYSENEHSYAFVSPSSPSPAPRFPSSTDPDMPSELDTGIGALYIGLVVCTFLHGVTISQAWHFFSSQNTIFQDPLSMKLLVAVLVLLDFVHQTCTSIWLYEYLITDFGNLEALTKIPKSYLGMGVPTGLVTLLVQGFRDPVTTQLAKPPVSTLVIVVNGLGAGVDLLIAISMVYLLGTRHTFRTLKTNRMIRSIAIHSVTTGAVTSICALLVLITATAFKKGLYLLLFYLLLTRSQSFYAFDSQYTKLVIRPAALNVRDTIRPTSDCSEGAVNSASFARPQFSNALLSVSSGSEVYNLDERNLKQVEGGEQEGVAIIKIAARREGRLRVGGEGHS